MSSSTVRRLIFGLATLVVLSLGFLLLIRMGVVAHPLPATVKGDLAAARSDEPGHRVLFVGNSLTFFNDMPTLVRDLVAGADQAANPIVVEYTRGGWTLKNFSREKRLTRLVGDVAWDTVVLQEQSRVSAFSAADRNRWTLPYAQQLHREILITGAETVLFMTWGYRQGDASADPNDTYATMQRRVEATYRALGSALPAKVAPVGLAWAEALRRHPDLQLWADDGTHPSPLGSYLAACVFAASLFDVDPTTSEFTAGLAPRDARFLQKVAAETVATYQP